VNRRWGSAAAAVVGVALLAGCASPDQASGNSASLPTSNSSAVSTPRTTVPASGTTECAQSAPVPASDPDLLQAIHLDLDGYYRPYYRSDPTPVCGAQSLVVAYAESENAGSPQKIDVLVYDPAAKQWTVVQTLDPNNGASPPPTVPADDTCQGECIRTAHLTDGDIDFLVQGGDPTLANGLTVVSAKDGSWRMAPFLTMPSNTGSSTYVPAASVIDNNVHVDVNDCIPDCATGQQQKVVYTYDVDHQAFEGGP